MNNDRNRRNHNKRNWNNNNNNKEFNRDKNRNFGFGKFAKKDSNNNQLKVVSTNISKEKPNFKDNNRINNFSKHEERQQNNNIKKDKPYNNTYSKQRIFNLQEKKNFTSVNKRTIKPYLMKNLDKKICCKCEKIITYMSSAFEDKENKFYHFECIFNDIKDKNDMKPTQRLVYVGSGTFAIIEDINENGKMKFSIKKKISYFTV